MALENAFQRRLQQREGRRSDDRGKQWNIASDNQVEPQVFRSDDDDDDDVRKCTVRDAIDAAVDSCLRAGREDRGTDWRSCMRVDDCRRRICQLTAFTEASAQSMPTSARKRHYDSDYTYQHRRTAFTIICHLYKTI